MPVSNRYPAWAAPSPADIPRVRPIPANDNLPHRVPTRVRPPLPANDNLPGWRPRAPLGPAAKRTVAKVAWRVGRRFIPVVGWAITAWEIYDLAREWSEDYWTIPGQGLLGYEQIAECTLHTWTSRYLKASIFERPCGDSWGNPMAEWDWSFNPILIWEWWFTDEYNAVWGMNEHNWRYMYKRIDGQPEYGPAPDVPYIPSPVLPWVPWIEPLSPPFSPTPRPVPLPVRTPGYSAPPNPEDATPARGYAPPGQKVERPQPRLRSERARKRTKERKVAARSGVRAALGWLLSGYSEVGDLVDALYDALPDNIKSRADKNMWDKFERLYENVNDIDMAQAVSNIIENEVADRNMAGAFAEMQDVFEGFGVELPDLRGIGGTSGPWAGSFR